MYLRRKLIDDFQKELDRIKQREEYEASLSDKEKVRRSLEREIKRKNLNKIIERLKVNNYE